MAARGPHRSGAEPDLAGSVHRDADSESEVSSAKLVGIRVDDTGTRTQNRTSGCSDLKNKAR